VYFRSWRKDDVCQRKHLTSILANVVWVEDEWFVLGNDLTEKHEDSLLLIYYNDFYEISRFKLKLLL